MIEPPDNQPIIPTIHPTDHLMTMPDQYASTSDISAKRGPGNQAQNKTVIRRGILTAFNPTNYTANVLLFEATGTYLQDVPVAYHIDGTSAQKNNLCAVLFFDMQNYTDAVILAIFPN